MGWFFEGWHTRKCLIDNLTRNRRYRRSAGSVARLTCLASCYRGGMFSGILWSVWQRTVEELGVSIEPVMRWIRCDLLSYQAGWGWGVKSFGESDWPFYYSCPLGYLRMVPVANAGWRARVREYHRRLKAKRAAPAEALLSVSRCMKQPTIAPAGRRGHRQLLRVLLHEERLHESQHP